MQRHTPWQFSPAPNELGVVTLEPVFLHWLKWTGETTEPLTLMLPTPMLLDRIEMTGEHSSGRGCGFKVHTVASVGS